jgi:Flp pilus assembly protein TadD
MSAPTTERPSSNVQRWRVAGLSLALAAITFAVFGQTLTHEFVDYDDNEYVYLNPTVARGLTLKGIAWAFSFHASNWHPLTWLSHMLDCQLYGLHPGGHHLTNVLLHAATVIALFLVLRRMTGALWRSAFVAAVFAIHPLRVESVAWVAERKDVLSGLFFMLTIGAYVRYASRPWSAARYGLVVLLFALGLMCKPMLVTLPVALLLLDYWPLQRAEPVWKLVKEKLPLLALSAAACVVTLLAQTEAVQSIETVSLPLRLANTLASGMVYLGQIIYPAGLAVFYPYPYNGLPAWEVALAGTVLAGLSGVAWWQRGRRPWLWMGWLWYLVMLLPVAGIIQTGEQAHADRYTYLPQIGIYVAITWLMAEWGASWRAGRAALGSLMAAGLVVLMVCAWQQTAYWKNSETLWTHTLGCTTDNQVAHNGLGGSLLQNGKLDEAIAQYQIALEINPGHANSGYADTQYNLGNVLLQMGRREEAVAHFQKALEIKPGDAKTHSNLGLALLQTGRTDEATVHFQKALQLEPDDPAIQNNLAWVFAACPQASLRNGARAVQLAQRANDLAGGRNPVYLHTLAAAFAETGRFGDAMNAAQKAMELARATGQQDLAARLNEELKRYQAGLPLHP